MDDWIDHNPPKFGVNWACTMDVAIRVANWILGFYFFRDSKAFTDEFLIKFLKSLLIHGRHIMANLENKGITNNHYLADLVGLIYLGIAFPEFKEARRWREFGVQELVKEMEKQVYDDGMDFEASTCYHRLALELFFYPAVLCRLNGIELPQPFHEKLKKMFDFVLYVLKPNGRMPQIGDNDNGRLHVLGKRDILDMTYLLTFATLYFGDPSYKIEEFGFASEALWLFGPEAYERWKKMRGRSVEELESKAFPKGGIYVMRHKRDYMIISCGSIGQGGPGGHAHNDKLSFELCIDGEDIIVDPGTGVYTGNPFVRDRLRSLTSHNAPFTTYKLSEVEKFEGLFINRSNIKVKVLNWKPKGKKIQLMAERSFLGNSFPMSRHLFMFDIASRIQAVVFIYSRNIDAPLIIRLCFAPRLSLAQKPNGEIWAYACDSQFRIRIAPIWEDARPVLALKTGLYSHGYGNLQETPVVEYIWFPPHTRKRGILFQAIPASTYKYVPLELSMDFPLDEGR